MTKLKWMFITFLFLTQAFASEVIANEWTNLSHGGMVSTIVEDASNIWIGTRGGLMQQNKATQETTFYTAANSGLVGNWVTNLMRDSQQRLWVGTWHGLSCFDGQDWQHYTTTNSALPANHIRGLAEAPDGSIWVAAQTRHADDSLSGGLVHLDGNNWTIYTPQNSGLPDAWIQALDVDLNGHVWFGAVFWGGVVEFDGTEWMTHTAENTGYQSGSAYTVKVAENGDVWVGGFGLSRFDGIEWEHMTEDNGLPNNTVSALSFDFQGNLWAVMGDIVGRFNGSDWLIYPATGAIAALSDDDQNLWVGTYYHLLKFDGMTWTVVPHSNSQLRSNTIYSIAIDPVGQTWINNESLLFEVTSDSLVWHEAVGLNFHSEVITANNNGDIWLGTEDNGIIHYDGTTWTVYDETNSGFPGYEVLDLAVGTDNAIWVAISYGGLARFDGQNWTIYHPDTSDFPSNRVWSVSVAPTGDVWAGTQDAGLAHFDGATWTVYDEGNSGLPASPIQDVLVTASGEVWLGTQDAGLVHFDGVNWDIYDTTNSDLPDDWINALALDVDGSIFVGTRQGGLARFDGTDWQVYTPENSGMPHTLVRSLAIDAAGNKWIGTAGLTIFNEDGIMAVEDAETPETAATVPLLQQNYPNPWFLSPAKGNPSTTIAFSLPSKQALTLRIYNTAGQLVKTLLDDTDSTPAGTHEVTWDGRNEHGLPVSSGVYFYRLEASATNSPFEGGQGDVIQTRRMVLLR